MYHGIINVYKGPGYISHDVVAWLRGTLKQKKIDHTGTPDLVAEGVLSVRLGTGARLYDMLTDQFKIYQAVVLLGCEAGTQDTIETILAENRGGALSLTGKQIRDAVVGFRDNYAQIPLMYSAFKVDRKKLCELAGVEKEVGRQPRPV